MTTNSSPSQCTASSRTPPGPLWADLFHVEYDDNSAWPVSSAGNPFHFVASVPGWHYRRTGADSILLFFEPVERLALLTFDWS
ncbi:hypothetical protein ACFV8T_39945 [Streptomyces sp. NPDC059832]|uniref:hypothetical protein n=1 Tax=unclassified Streptomyces TaxID=2593676 RepID=UPI003657E6A2